MNDLAAVLTLCTTRRKNKKAKGLAASEGGNVSLRVPSGPSSSLISLLGVATYCQ
ncbi:hypothetical protein PGT21_000459 [Puccinia graminis f. sp. tritici]|uniref:Uncharacterized protein n=1 Tax=Puccinia graminis f. sp. tritici TaxID=56615 RepID=A0A5B0Q1F8_PUCGR|nr:hypothetical protein PGTUg99_009629 [Puccinia graminis f. sp. tritici]KAA1111275.1 hypothetical protein PGT21_000459 [Puccinia graminis f. sp. tritici]